MSLIETLRARSANVFEDGKWVPIAEVPGWEVRVRPWSALAAQEMQADLLEALPDDVREKPRLPWRRAKDIEAQVILDVCLVDWRGVDEPYSREAAQSILSDQDLRWGRRAIVGAIDRVEKEALEARENDVKN